MPFGRILNQPPLERILGAKRARFLLACYTRHPEYVAAVARGAPATRWTGPRMVRSPNGGAPLPASAAPVAWSVDPRNRCRATFGPPSNSEPPQDERLPE